MKQENAKKSKLWLWIVIGAVALLAIVGVVLALVLGGNEPAADPTPTRPELYWNLDRKQFLDAETGLSNRPAGEDGVYRVRFAYEGQILEFPIQDKRLVNSIDGADAMGLEFDETGTVINMTRARDIAEEISTSCYVLNTNDGVLRVNSSVVMNGMGMNFPLDENLKIYNVSPSATQPGEVMNPEDLPVMACLQIYGLDEDTATHAFFFSEPERSDIYWRVEQKYNRTTKSTTRVPERDGADDIYTIDFFCNGEKVALKTKREPLASAIDSKNVWDPYFAFSFDKDGYIIGIIDAGSASRSRIAFSRLIVTEVNGNFFTATNLGGYSTTEAITDSYTGTFGENCAIYDVSKLAMVEGTQGKPVDSLQVGDRITAWTDFEGNLKTIYISLRMVDSEPYYNVERKLNKDGTSSRTPDSRGYYAIDFMLDGKTTTYYCKDKKIVDFIDQAYSQILGLKLNGTVIEQAYDYENVFGNVWKFDGYYVRSADGGPIFVAGNEADTAQYNTIIGANCRIYDMSGITPLGTATELQVGDKVRVYRYADETAAMIFVQTRKVAGTKLYYSFDRMYSSITKETYRKPDADGYYVYQMACDGKQYTLKTKSKEFATKIDKNSPCVAALTVSGDIITGVYPPTAVFGGAWGASNMYFEKYTDEEKTAITGYHRTNDARATLLLSEECKTYNVSLLFNKYRGEASTIREADSLIAFKDTYGKVVRILIRERETGDLCWNMEQMYDYYNKVTLRQPDAEGYYNFKIATNGVVRTFKTKDKAVATAVDSNATGVCFIRDGNTIYSAAGYNYVYGVESTVAGWDVVSVSGRSFTLQNKIPGDAKYGEKVTCPITSKTQIYDVRPDAAKPGAAAKLSVGDRVEAFLDKDGNARFVYIYHHERIAHCSHCDKDVVWQPYSGGDVVAADAHYYVTRDITVGRALNIGKADKDYEIVFDMNGKTINQQTATRFFILSNGETLTLLDSVGGGKVTSIGKTDGFGGVVLASGKATVNMYGGTLMQVESDQNVAQGGVICITGEGTTFNLYGGTITGGHAEATEKYPGAYGGNILVNAKAILNVYGGEITGGTNTSIYVNGSTMNMSGGVISGGTGNTSGHLRLVNSQFTMSGGQLVGGVATGTGGNIFAYKSNVKITGDAQILDGQAARGGNIYMQNESVMTVDGGTISGGKVTVAGANIFVGPGMELTLSGGIVKGGVFANKPNKLVLSGKIQLDGTAAGLNLYEGTLADFSGLTEGALVVVSAKGAISDPFEGAKAIVDAGLVKAVEGYQVVADQNNVLVVQAVSAGGGDYSNIHTKAEQMTADKIFESGEEVQAECPVCNKTVTWQPLTATKMTIADGQTNAHYYLAEDKTNSSLTYTGTAGNYCLHLNGHNITSTAERALCVTDGSTLNVMGEGIVMGAGKNNNGTLLGAGLDAYGTANLMGGTFQSSGTMPVVTVNRASGKVYMYDGAKIVGSANIDGAVYLPVSGSRIYIKGGAIEAAGGVAMKITGGICNASAGTILGDVSVLKTGTFTLSGTTVDAINANEGYLYLLGGTVKQAKVDAAKLLKLGNDMVIEELTLTKGTMADVSTLTEKAKICVIADGAFTAAMENAQSFIDDKLIVTDSMHKLSAVEGVLTVEMLSEAELAKTNEAAVKMTTDGVFANGGEVSAPCPVCGGEENVTWLPVGTELTIAEGQTHAHYYLAGPITNASRLLYTKVAGTYCLHLNGQSITTTAGRALCATNGSTLNIMGEGTVTGAGADGQVVGLGAAIDMYAGTVNLYGGTYATSTARPVITMFDAAAVLNIFPGVSVQGTIYTATSGAVINMYGGNVDSINVTNASLNLLGGSVKDVTAASTKTLRLVGDRKIEKLTLASGTVADVSGLTENAKVFAVANGAFTTAFDNAQSFIDNKLIVTDDNLQLKATDGVLSITIPVEDLAKISEAAVKMTTDGVFANGGEVSAPCPVCGGEENVTWLPLTGRTINIASGADHAHYYLPEGGFTHTQLMYTSADGIEGTYCLHLNGNNITITAKQALYVGVGDTLNIMGEGTITGTGTHQASTGIYWGTALDVEGTVNLYGGTYAGSQARPAITLRNAAAVANIYPGAVIEGQANIPGAIYSATAGAVCNMYGGTINCNGSPAVQMPEGAFTQYAGTINETTSAAP